MKEDQKNIEYEDAIIKILSGLPLHRAIEILKNVSTEILYSSTVQEVSLDQHKEGEL